MPRVPPVTKAVIPLSDHLFSLLLISASAMFISVNSQVSETEVTEICTGVNNANQHNHLCSYVAALYRIWLAWHPHVDAMNILGNVVVSCANQASKVVLKSLLPQKKVGYFK